MKTVITQKIDGYDIIVGIGEAQIDPMKTYPIATQAANETEVVKKIDAIKNEMKTLAVMAAQAKKNEKSSKTKADINKFFYEWKSRLDEFTAKQEELKPLVLEFQEVYKNLVIKHAVYFQPKQGESIISEEKSVEIFNNLQKVIKNGNQLDIELKEIPDLRGKIYWKKIQSAWFKKIINKLGEVPDNGYIHQNDLTEDQVKEIEEFLLKERISKLTAAQKLAEKNNILENLAQRAVTMKSKLEIQGDKKALDTSKEWYTAESAKIEALYS